MLKIYSDSLALILIFFLTFSSCQTKERQPETEVMLEYLADVILPIDEETSISENGYHFSKEGILYLLNKGRQRIQLYDWSTKTLIKKIQLEFEGPNGTGEAAGITTSGKDSIFVVSPYHFRVSQLDSNGRLIKKYSLLSAGVYQDEQTLAPPQGGYSSMVSGNISNPIYIANGFLVAGASPVLNPIEENYYTQGKVGVFLDLKADTLSYFMPFPLLYMDKFRHSYRFPTHFVRGSMCYNREKNLMVTSFPIDNQVYAFSLSNHEISSHSASSSYFKEVKLMTKPSLNPNVNFKHTMSNPHYGNICYNPYTRQYFRFVNHPNPTKKDKTDGKPWIFNSLIIMDEKFNKLGEVMLDIVTDGFLFFSQDGIYINSYTGHSEDELVFRHYRVLEK